VATRRWILFLLAAAILALAGCNSGSTFNVQNPPPPPPPNISIAFQPAPAGTILIDTTTSLTAVVSNDPSNSGVSWSVTCSVTGNCGQLSAQHTASGEATTYTPPASLAGNSLNVNIVAFATASQATNVVAPITVTAFGSNLKGTYVLEATGADSNFNPYQFAGVIVLDGNGGISSGEQTVNFSDPTTGLFVAKSDAINNVGSSYFLGPDGRGTITLNPNDADIGAETFSLVFLSNSQALIAALPTSTLTISGTGTMDMQTATAAPTGGYAFAVSGTDVTSASPMAFAGILNIDSPNNISGKGSVADQNFAGTLASSSGNVSGTVSDPDLLGAVTLNLTIPGFSPTTTYQFTGYIVDNNHIKLIESDNTSGTGSGSTAGIAIGQGAATGTFKTATSFSGTYVFGVMGVDLAGTTPATLTSAGVFTADGSGDLTNGYTDTALQQNGAQGTSGAEISASFSGKYSVDVKGTGRVQSNFLDFVPRQIPNFHPKFFFYLTGNGNPALVLDGGDISAYYPSLGTGIAYPQAAAPLTFGGNYGFSFSQQNGSEDDGTAQMAANRATTPPSLSGFADDSRAGDQPFSGTFTAPAASGNGVFAGSLENGIGGSAFPASPFNVDYYVIDQYHGFFVETDLVNGPTTGQVSFGYYAGRTPVCAGCP
jgi:hypothetical protein